MSNFFEKSEIFLQKNATEKNLYKSINPNYSFIAFATHAVRGMNNFFLERGLVLTPLSSEDQDADGFLSSSEIKSLNLSYNSTVVLTACNTLEQKYYLSSPFSGLPESFMAAGASGVLFSMWNVNTNSSSLINQEIFSAKNNKRAFIDSYRSSILKVKSKENFAHPYFWASYAYLGK